MRIRDLFTIVVSGLLLADQASAFWQINFKEVGADVVVTASGNLDLTGLSFVASGPTESVSGITSGDADTIISNQGNLDAYQTPVAPDLFSEIFEFTGVSTGSAFALYVVSPTISFLYTPAGFSSGAINGSITISDITLAELGVNPFELTWGEGENQGYEITVGAAVPEPASTGFAIGLGSLFFLVVRFRRNRKA